jgi:hypothetical protein
MPTHFLIAAKAYVALIGAVVTALLAVYGPDTKVGQVLTIVSVIATAVNPGDSVHPAG